MLGLAEHRERGRPTRTRKCCTCCNQVYCGPQEVYVPLQTELVSIEGQSNVTLVVLLSWISITLQAVSRQPSTRQTRPPAAAATAPCASHAPRL